MTRWSPRSVGALGGMGLLALAGAAVAWLAGPDGRPAAAAPLATICDATGASLRVVPSSLVLVGDAVTGEHHERSGFPATVIASTSDPDGSPSITARNLQPVDLDGDGRTDLQLALGLRASTAPETVASATGDSPLDALLTQNFGHRPDSAPSGTGVGVTGLDLVVEAPPTSWIHRTGHYTARVQVRVERVIGGRAVDELEVAFTIDSLQAAARSASARFPGETRMSVALVEPGEGGNDSLGAWAVGHEVVYPGVAGVGARHDLPVGLRRARLAGPRAQRRAGAGAVHPRRAGPAERDLSQSIAFTRSDPIPRGFGVLFPPLAGALVPGLGAVGTPPALAIDALADNADLDACLDFDLPLVLTATHTTTARLARAGVSFGLDHDGGQGANAALDVGEILTSASGNPSLREGVPYAYRSVDYDAGSTTTSSGVVTDAWKDVLALPTPGVIVTPPLSCGGTGPSLRYFPGIPTGGGALRASTFFTRAITGRVTDRDGATTGVVLQRADFELDLLWDVSERGALAARDLAGRDDCPGVRLYDGLAGLATPPTSLPVAVLPTCTAEGELDVEEAEYTITQADALAAGLAFCSLAGFATAAENRPVAGTTPDYPVAVGADGTRYSLEIWTEDPNQTYCRINLVARHPGGALRWTRRIAGNAGPIAFWPLEWTVRILPRADDGSVELQLRQHDLRVGTAPTRDKVWLQVFDASGNGEVILGEHPDLAPVLGLLQGTPPDLRLAVTELQPGGRCVTLAAAAPAPVGTTRVWWFGDGGRYLDLPDTLEPHDLDRCYDRTGDYFVQAMDFRHVVDAAGNVRTEVAGSRRWRVHVPA